MQGFGFHARLRRRAADHLPAPVADAGAPALPLVERAAACYATGGSQRERGHVPRFVVVRGQSITGLVETFERAATALPSDIDFRDVEVVAHRARRAGRAFALTLVVDRPSGVDVHLCERIAARLNAELDREDEPYTLEVESPGLDRPLVRPTDYERFRGRFARVVTTLPVRGQKTHRGTLGGVRGAAVILEQDGGEFPVPFEMIKSANLEFDPREDLRREKRERKDRR